MVRENSDTFSSIPVLNLSKSYPQKKTILQDVADISYIPLETNNDVLMTISDRVSYYSDNYIVIHHPRRGDVFLFGPNGKLKFQFNHRGEGPEEYSYIYSLMFDEKQREVFIFDRSREKFLVYFEDGTYKRTLSCLSNVRLRAWNFDDKNMLVYDEYGLLANQYSKQPYMLLSKADGHIATVLPRTLAARYTNVVIQNVVTRDGQSGLMPITVYIPNNWSYGEEFIISDISSDTIYSLSKQKKLKPMLARTPSVHDDRHAKIMLTVMFTAASFICLRKTVMDINQIINDRTYPATDLMHELKTHETFEMIWVNNDIPSRSDWMFEVASTPKNVGICKMSAIDLTEALEDGKLQGQLKNVAEKLDEEDNPVLMIVKFK